MQATVAGGVPPALTEAVAAALTVGIKQADRVEALATVADGVPPALAEAVAAAPAMGIKQAHRREILTTAAGGVSLPPGC